MLVSCICFLQLRLSSWGETFRGAVHALPWRSHHRAFSGRRGRGDGGGLWGCTFPMDSPPGPSARAGAGQVDPRAPGGAEGMTSGAGRGCPSRDSPGRCRNLVSPAAWAWRCCGLCGPGSQRGQPQPRLPVPTRLEGHFLPATGSLLF